MLRRERGRRRGSEQGQHPWAVSEERASDTWGRQGKDLGEGRSIRRKSTSRKKGQVVVVGASILDLTAKLKSPNILVSRQETTVPMKRIGQSSSF